MIQKVIARDPCLRTQAESSYRRHSSRIALAKFLWIKLRSAVGFSRIKIPALRQQGYSVDGGPESETVCRSRKTHARIH